MRTAVIFVGGGIFALVAALVAFVIIGIRNGGMN